MGYIYPVLQQCFLVYRDFFVLFVLAEQLYIRIERSMDKAIVQVECQRAKKTTVARMLIQVSWFVHLIMTAKLSSLRREQEKKQYSLLL